MSTKCSDTNQGCEDVHIYIFVNYKPLLGGAFGVTQFTYLLRTSLELSQGFLNPLQETNNKPNYVIQLIQVLNCVNSHQLLRKEPFSLTVICKHLWN